MNDQATLLKWAQQLPFSPNGKEACAKLLEAVSHQRLALPAIHEAGLLQPLCAALRSKEAPAQQRAVAVLLEASRCGPGGEMELAAAPGCCQALLDLVATNMPTSSTVFEAVQHHQQQLQQDPTSSTVSTAPQAHSPANTTTAADCTSSGISSQRPYSSALRPSSRKQLQLQPQQQPQPMLPQLQDKPAGVNVWEDPQQAARSACTLLWRISSDPEARELLMSGTNALVQVLMVLLANPSATLRLAASGALYNLSQASRVQAQLVSRAQELLPILIGLLARAGPDLHSALAASSSTGGGACSPGLALYPDSASASASGRTSPDVSPRRPSLIAAATTAAPATPQSVFSSPMHAARRGSRTVQLQEAVPQPQQSYCFQHGFLQAGSGNPNNGGPAVQGRSDVHGGVGSIGPWYSQPSSPFGTAPVAATPGSMADSVAATLTHVAGLLRVLFCHGSVAVAMVCREGQPLKRLLRAMAQVGCSTAFVIRTQPSQQSLLWYLMRFQLLCGGAIAALAGHGPLAALAGSGSITGSSLSVSASSGSGGAAGSVSRGSAVSVVAPAVMTAVYGCCCEADATGLTVLAGNAGVATALAMALQYGARALGVDVTLTLPHPHSQAVGPGPIAASVDSNASASISGALGIVPGVVASASLAPSGMANVVVSFDGGASVGVAGGSGVTGVSAPLDPAASLSAAAFALHTLRVIGGSSQATEALVVADCGALAIVRTLSYFMLHRSIEPRTPLDEEAFAMQALASGTLARLAGQAAAQNAPVVREGLSPPLEGLSAMALLLLLPPAVPPPLVWGAGAGEAAAAASRSYVASLLAAIAQYGTYSYDMFTQVIVNTRGALGAIISLLSSPGGGTPTNRGERESQQLVVTGLGLADPATGAVAAGTAARPESAAVSGGRGAVGEAYEDAATAGVAAALALCTVAAHSRDVARVLAGKTTLVPTLLAALRERRTVPNPTPDSLGPNGWQSQGHGQVELRVKALKLMCTLTTQLGEASVRSELVADSGLVSALMACLGPQQQPGVVAAALEWLALLLQHPAFLQERMQGPTANDLLARVLELLQLLPLSTSTAAGALTPSRAASMATLSMSGTTTPGTSGGVAGSLAAAASAAAATTTPTSRRATPAAGSAGSSLRTGGSAHPNQTAGGRFEVGATNGGSGSLNSSLRGGGLGRAGGASSTNVPAVVDLSAGSPAVAAMAAVALHRLAASSVTLRNQLCAVPGLVSAVLRQVHGLLDQLAMDSYMLPAVTATRLSALLAVLCVLADSCAPSGLDLPLRVLQRRFSTLSSTNSRHYVHHRGNMDEPQPPGPGSGGVSVPSGGGTSGAPVADSKVAANPAAGDLPVAGLVGSVGSSLTSNGPTDALRQMLDAPYSLDVLCEAIDAMHAVLEAEERAQHARSAGTAVGSGCCGVGFGGGVGPGGGPSSARSKASGLIGRVQAAGSGVSPSTDASGASPTRQHAAAQGRTSPFSPGASTAQWSLPLSKLGADSAQQEAAGTWQGSGPGSPWATRDSSPGAGGPLSPTKRRRQSHGGNLPTADGVAGLLGSPFTLIAAPAQPPVERASPDQVADIRRNALGTLQRLVGFWSAAARAEVELADAVPGLLAELELQLQVGGHGSARPVMAGSSMRSSLIASSGGTDVLLLDHASNHLPQPPISATLPSRQNRMATSLPPLPQPLPPPLGDVVMLSYGGAKKGSSGAEAPHTSVAGAVQPHSSLLRRVVQVCCKLMVPSEPAQLRASATTVVATVLSLSEELAAVLALTLPQLLDRLLDAISLLANGGGGAIAEAANGGGIGARGGGNGVSFGATVAAAAAASVIRLDKQSSMTPVGVGRAIVGTGDGGADGMVSELQNRLQLDAEACLTALDLLLQLASNSWVKSRLANHPRLAEALDALLEEDAVVTLRALLDAAALAQPQQSQQHGGRHSAGGQQQQHQQHPAQTQQPLQHGPSASGTAGGGGDHMVRQGATEGVGGATGATGGTTSAAPGASIMFLSLASSGSLMTVASGPCAGTTDVRVLAAQLAAELAPHSNRSLMPPSGTTSGGLLRALDALLREGGRSSQVLAVTALWALVASPGGAGAVGASGVPRSLVALLRQGGPGPGPGPAGGSAGQGPGPVLGPHDISLRAQAVGVLAALVQRLDGAAAASLAAVEGLPGALLDVMGAAADLLARSVRHSSGNTGTAQGSSPKAGAGGGMFSGGSGGTFSHSSGDLPDVAILEQAAHLLLWSVTAVAGLSRSAAVAARFASLKSLQPALLSALKIRPLDIQFYAASLVGNLAGHTATATVMAGVRGVGRELVRQLKETRLDHEGPYSEPLLAAIRNLASSERGRQELASDPATVPCLVRALTVGCAGRGAGEGVMLPQQAIMAGAADVPQRLLAVQLAAAAALANLSCDRCGLEAMVADQELLLSPLWALARSLVVPAGPGFASSGSGASGGEWVHNRRINSRLRLFLCVLLANAMSHPVLAKTSLTLHDAMATLVALVLALPSPSRHAAQQDPLAPLRPRRQRMASVAVLDALKQLLVAVGPRALHSLQGRPAKSTSVASAAAMAGGPAPPAPPAPGPGAPGSPARLARLVDHVMDLLAWVDFHSAEEVAGDPGNAGMGADVAGAAAGVVGQLAVLGVVGRFPEYAASSCQSLVKLLVLPTLQPLPYGQGGGAVPGSSAAPGVLDVAAGHAAAAVWALVSNPLCKAWAQQFHSDIASHRVMLLLVRRGTRGGTRARFATARVFAATTLGQLAVQGGVSTSELPDLLATDNGLPGALLDLATLALTNQQSQQQQAQSGGGTGMAQGPATVTGARARGFGLGGQVHGQGMERHPVAAAGQGQGGATGGGAGAGIGVAGAGGRQPRSKDIDPQEQVRAAALAMVGAAGDIRLTIGLQAVGALAHLAGEAGGALLELPGLLDAVSRLLGCPLQEVCGLAAVLLGTLSSTGGWQACAAMARTPGLVEQLVAVLKSQDIQARAYCAVTLGNIANGPPPPSSPNLLPETSAAAAAFAVVDQIVGLGALGCLTSMLDECSRLLELQERRLRFQRQPADASVQQALPVLLKTPCGKPLHFLREGAEGRQFQQEPRITVPGASSGATNTGSGNDRDLRGISSGQPKVGCGVAVGATTAEEAAVDPAQGNTGLETAQGPSIAATISSLVVPLVTPQVAPLGGTAWPPSPVQRLQPTESRQQVLAQAGRGDMNGPSQGHGRPQSRFGSEIPKAAIKHGSGDDASSCVGQHAGLNDSGSTGPVNDMTQNRGNWQTLTPSLSAAAAAAGALQNLSLGHLATSSALIGPWLALTANETVQGKDVPPEALAKSFGKWLFEHVDALNSGAALDEGQAARLEHEDFLTSVLQLLLRCCQMFRHGCGCLEWELSELPVDGSMGASSPVSLLLHLTALLLGTLANISATSNGREAMLGILATAAQEFAVQRASAARPFAGPSSSDECGNHCESSTCSTTSSSKRSMDTFLRPAMLMTACLMGCLTLRPPAAEELLLTPSTQAGASEAAVMHHASEQVGSAIERTSCDHAQRRPMRVIAAAEDMLEEELTMSLRLTALGVCCNLLADEVSHVPVPADAGKEASFWDDAQALEREVSESCCSCAHPSGIAVISQHGATVVETDSMVVQGPEEMKYGSVVFRNDIGTMDGYNTDNSVGLAWPLANKEARTSDGYGRALLSDDASSAIQHNQHGVRGAADHVGVQSNSMPQQRLGRAVLLEALQCNSSLQAALLKLSGCNWGREQRTLRHMAVWLGATCRVAAVGSQTLQ